MEGGLFFSYNLFILCCLPVDNPECMRGRGLTRIFAVFFEDFNYGSESIPIGVEENKDEIQGFLHCAAR